ncbi:hypothetical protein PV04_00302 [Phialophora macrospora]|uniref:Uncharacterized protein n=1 Tax=Phialophora macrospora TaxID=1851006 RepID=A0A0D2D3K4_9EURO|nr:hypothetical protein PV04_00302 [Phialophora macrospora]
MEVDNGREASPESVLHGEWLQAKGSRWPPDVAYRLDQELKKTKLLDKPVGRHHLEQDVLQPVYAAIKPFFTGVKWDRTTEQQLYRKVHTRLVRLRHDRITRARHLRGPKRRGVLEEQFQQFEEQVTQQFQEFEEQITQQFQEFEDQVTRQFQRYEQGIEKVARRIQRYEQRLEEVARLAATAGQLDEAIVRCESREQRRPTSLERGLQSDRVRISALLSCHGESHQNGNP